MWGPPSILLLAIMAVCLLDHVSSDKAGDWILPPKLRLERALPTKGIGLEHLRSRDRSRHAGRSLLPSPRVGVVNFPLWGAANPFAVGLYYTRVQLGNPSKEFYVQIDTGSDTLWVACNPCNGCPTSSGLNIHLEYFNPETSFTSSQISCSDDRCTSGLQNGEALCSTSSSSNSPCSYSFQYGDGSGTSGYYVSDTMYFEAVMGNQQTVNSSATIVFGCSNSQTGDLTKSDRAVDGIFGFGQHQLSVISQLSSIGVTPRVFSHCLKGSDNGGGILVLGEIIEPGIVYTPLVPSQSHYNLHLESIAVNGKILSISSSVFEVSNTHGTIIDSGTTLAYLAEQAYDPFVNAIIASLSPSVRSVPHKGNECFITIGSIDESFPSVSLNFKGGASMPLKPEDYLLQQGYVDNSIIWCIGWQKNQGLGITILGDIILKDKIFVYDIANQRMGWTNYDCSQSVNVSVSSGKNQYLNAGQLDVNESSRIAAFDKLLWLSIVLVLHLLTSEEIIKFRSQVVKSTVGYERMQPFVYYTLENMEITWRDDIFKFAGGSFFVPFKSSLSPSRTRLQTAMATPPRRWNWLPRCRRRSAAFLFAVSASLLLGSTAVLFAWITFSPFPKPLPVSAVSSLGCRPDGEGSWSVGVFYGESPLSLKPIESWGVWRNASAAWPVANPVVTCATASDAGFPSNFVADPFLFIQGDDLYLFFETKNSITLQGDIGVAVSKDSGATWNHLGIALDELWHLSYPYVFNHQDNIYMMPEGSKKGDLRLYRAVEFPLKWELEKVILKKPLIDSFIVNYGGYFWLFGSDFSAPGAKKNGELEIWYSSSPLGPWLPHKQNPVHNMDKSLGARNAGRPFTYKGQFYRAGQDCGGTYGRRVRLFKVEILTKDAYEEVEVPLGVDEPQKGRNAWNGARYHHLDVQQLTADRWVAVMDGDRVPSGDAVRRLVVGYTAFGAALALVLLIGLILSVIRCVLPFDRCLLPLSRKRSNFTGAQQRDLRVSAKLRSLLGQLNKIAYALKERVRADNCAGRFVVVIILVAAVALTCIGTHYVYGGNGVDEAYSVKGHYSQFTLIAMTYDARLWNLKMYIEHYSRCTSVGEILVVWNKGQPPNVSIEFDSAVPVEIRVEKRNSLNNRFNVDPSIKTRAVLELDDDIMMTCDDVERGFKVWRDHPDRIVGFYPRLAEGTPLKYRDERYARSHGGYNMILTGAAFMDHKLAFERYWSEEAKIGRDIVDEFFNCEDLLMNYLYANASLSRKVIEYVRPSWAIDTSKFSGVAISKDTQAHYRVRSECLAKFGELYGDLVANKWRFGARKDGWDV